MICSSHSSLYDHVHKTALGSIQQLSSGCKGEAFRCYQSVRNMKLTMYHLVLGWIFASTSHYILIKYKADLFCNSRDTIQLFHVCLPELWTFDRRALYQITAAEFPRLDGLADVVSLTRGRVMSARGSLPPAGQGRASA